VGLEPFAFDGYFELIDRLVAHDRKVFADLKLFDVPETVGSALRQLALRPITFNDSILEAAAGEKGDLQILAVTVLTCLDQNHLRDMGFGGDVQSLVLTRVRRGQGPRCDHVIS
jgi:orotidine-5'-phosphate decarboxylase